jgi:hypothetical protein
MYGAYQQNILTFQSLSHVHDGCQKEIITFRSFTGRYMTVVSKRALPFKTLVMYTMAASRKWLPFEALQVGIWRLSAGDPYLSKPYRHVQKAASMTCIHFESLQLDTSIIWSLPADDSYLSNPYSHVHKSANRKCYTVPNFTIRYIAVTSRRSLPYTTLQSCTRWLPARNAYISKLYIIIFKLMNAVSIW